MKIINSKLELSQLRKTISSLHLGFVPTMGALHEGHLSLIKRSISECDKTLVSIFINPLQFNQKEDYQNYPKTIDNDIKLLENQGIDYVYIPSEKEIGIDENSVGIDFHPLDTHWEGKYRKNHFRGVGIIVAKLFHQVQPQTAYFGLKDYQQYLLISKMVNSLDFPLIVKGVETVRDDKGLALSSRNQLLSEQGLKVASEINIILKKAKNQLNKGYDVNHVIEQAKNAFSEQKNIKVEYFALASQETLEEVKISSNIKNSILLVAVYIENIRLIDNLFVTGK